MSLRHVTRNFTSKTPLTQLPKLRDATVESFRTNAFSPSTPAIFPRGHFASYPAIAKWFEDVGGSEHRLKTKYLAPHGSVIVPLEVTTQDDGREFTRVERPFSDFLSFVEQMQQDALCASSENKIGLKRLQIYLAQCSLSTLPTSLNADLPTPDIVSQAGRGDIYDSSIWIGLAPTYTPLHKDPNPNLFVQLAGMKVVRIFEPAMGAGIFHEAQRRIHRTSSASFRGDEMMQGAEKEALEELVWRSKELTAGYEATVSSGDCIYIPKGWWHSFKGLGEGIVGSKGQLVVSMKKNKV